VLIADVSEHSIVSIFKGRSIDLPLKMEPIECSETSAISTQTPGKHPKENILHLKHGESLKSRNTIEKLSVLLGCGVVSSTLRDNMLVSSSRVEMYKKLEL
jgi:hypothetical protein